MDNSLSVIHSRLSRCNTARGYCSGLSLGSPTKVEARKSYLLTEGSLKVENNEHLFEFVVYFQEFEDDKIISQIVGISED